MQELAWAAGFFDAEGSCVYTPQNGSFQLAIYQADPAPLERFQRIVGTGQVGGPYTSSTGFNKKPMWGYRIYASDRVLAIMTKLGPLLCQPKRRQATAALEASGVDAVGILGEEDGGFGLRTNTSLAWAAGFLEGDGCFSYSSSNRTTVVSIPQTDRIPVDRFASALGLGKVYGPYEPHPTSAGIKPFFNFRAHGHERTQAIAAMLWPWLGPAKHAQILGVLTQARAEAPGTRCSRGHRKSPIKHGCPECHRDFWHRYRKGIGPQGSLFEEALPYRGVSGFTPPPAA